MGEILVTMATKVLSSFVSSTLKESYKQLTTAPAFIRAAKKTKAAFPDIEISIALTKWFESNEFATFFRDVKDGKQQLLGESVVKSFIEVTGFYCGESTQEAALRVLTHFFQELDHELLISTEGVSVLAKKISFNHEETIKTIGQTNSDTQQILGQKLDLILKTINSSKESFNDKTEESVVDEKLFHERVNVARSLLEQGQPKTAQKLLETLRQELKSRSVSNGILFRIATNIGSCAIQLDNIELATSEIRLAYELESNNPKAITNLSLIRRLNGQFEEALQLAQSARELIKNDPVATGNFIQALWALKRYSELNDLLVREPWINNDTNCCFVLGSLYFEQSNFEEAQKYFRLANQSKPDDSNIQIRLAHSIIHPIQNSLLGTPILRWRFPKEAIASFREAEDLLSDAIKTSEGYEDKIQLAFAHVLRADIRRMTDRQNESISDCEIALHYEPNNDTALAIKAMVLLNQGKVGEAITCFERIVNEDVKLSILLPLTTAYNAQNQPSKAIHLLKPLWNPNSKDLKQLSIAERLLSSYHQQGDAESAKDVIKVIQNFWPKEPEAMTVIASYEKSIGNEETAIALLTEALSYAQGPARDFIALGLADLHYQNENYANAAELLESVADTSNINPISTRYLVSLFNSGAHEAALELAQRLRADFEPFPVISEVEAYVLAEIGDLERATLIFEDLIKKDSKNYNYKITAAEYSIRRVKNDVAKEYVKAIRFTDVENDAKALIRITQLRAALNMGEVLKYVYQARRVGYTKAEVHAAYAGFFVNREQIDTAELTKDIVDSDCAVILSIEGNQRTFTVLSDPVIHKECGEISPENARSLQLLGRRKGERFVFRKDPFGKDIEATIVEVQSKYVRAFQETLEKFETMFPNETIFQGVSASPEDIRDSMLKQLDEQQKEFQKVSAFYESRKITFEALAQVLHKTPIELWGLCIGGRYFKLLVFDGTFQDFEAERSTAERAESILLEITSVLTLAQLDLLECSAQRYQLFTTQPVLDSISEALNKVSIAKPYMTLGKDGEQYVRQEVTKDNLQNSKKFFDRILQFLKSNTKILSVRSLLDQSSISKNIRTLLGPVSTSTAFAARDHKKILYSDDQMLRALAKNEWQVSGISIQAIVSELKRSEVINETRYNEAIVRLVQLNYSFIRVTVDIVVWAIENNNSQPNIAVKQLLGVFHGPQCTTDSAIAVLAQVVKRIWFTNSLYHHKVDSLHLILEALTTNRPTQQILNDFSEVIRSLLYLAPHTAQALINLIEMWQRSKLGRSGIIITTERNKRKV